MNWMTSSTTTKLLSFLCEQHCDSADMLDETMYLYKDLADKFYKIHIEVDKSLSQFYTNSVKWSPQIQVHCDHIYY